MGRRKRKGRLRRSDGDELFRENEWKEACVELNGRMGRLE